MLTDQEIPEMSEDPKNQSVPEENSTPPAEQTPEPPTVEDVPTEGEAQPTPDSQEPVEELTSDEASPITLSEESSSPVTEETSVEEPPAVEPEVVAEVPEPTQEAEEEPASEEADNNSLAPVLPIPADLPPLNEAVVTRMGEILAEKGASMHVLTHATIGDLIHLMDQFLGADNLLGQSPKVGLVKRSYDTFKHQGDLDKTLEEAFLSRIARFNQMRVQAEKKMDGIRAVNLEKKRGLLVKLGEVVQAEDPQRIDEVRAIQEEWKSIGQVPKAHLDELYTEYRAHLDKFYQLREMHLELMEYDRKINLQEKERLIAEAKSRLIPAEEEREDPEVWREKMDLLGELQQQWKSVGHVPREDMERINGDYRSIIDEFFEIRQGFREKLDELRQVNADQKVALLAKMEEYREFDADRPRAWNDANRIFREYQEAYKAIGQAPQSVNGELWAKYRDICNVFYTRKSAFFQKFDELRQKNLEEKKVLVERAEELAKGGDWERSAKELKRLQRDWKQIGPVPERHSNKLWNRFREACDSFFESRRLHYNELHAEEHENLEKKKALIAEVQKLREGAGGDVPQMIERVKELQRSWREIGKVPYKEKDKIWEEFREEVDAFFNGLPAKRSEIREMRNKTSIDSIDDLDERSKAIKDRIQRLRRKMTRSRETITQYLENMDRIARGKSGDPLRKQIQGEIDKEEQLIQEWRKQIKEFNEMLKNPPEKAPPVEESPATTPEAEQPTAEAPAASPEEEVQEETTHAEPAAPANESEESDDKPADA